MKNRYRKSKLNEVRKIFLLIIAVITVAFNSTVVIAQSPNLGTASSYALFTSAGAFNNTGSSVLTGDVGTNAGAFSGFPPGTINGQTHVADAASLAAANDLIIAYNSLIGMPCGAVLSVGLGNGQTITPNTYCIGAASTLNGNLNLDAGGDPDAIFVIKIDGAFATGVASNVILTNGANLCNVYWQING